MTRSEIIEALATRFPQLTLQDVDIAVREIIDAIAAALVAGQRIEIRGFGSFSLSYRPARQGRNPKTGEEIAVPGKYVPHFKPGKELRLQIDNAPSESSAPSAAKRRQAG